MTTLPPLRRLLAAATLAAGLGLAPALRAAQPNDQFADRIPLVGTDVTVGGTNLNATLEAGEPNHGAAWSKTGGKSIWWSWTAPSAGYARIRNKCNFHHLLAVYTGSALTDLTLVGSSYDNSGSSADVLFKPISGATYQIAVDGQSGASGTNLLTLTHTPAPSNDAFADRVLLTGAHVTTNGYNRGATRETGEPDHGGYPGGSSVWWQWTPPAGGRVTISASGSFYKVLAVYTGTGLSALAPVASAAHHSTVTLSYDVIAGIPQQIAVDGQEEDDSGTSLTLAITLEPPPTNDAFADRIPVTGTHVGLEGANLSASQEAGEPDHAGQPGGQSVWWTWTAPSDGLYAVRFYGEQTLLLALYTGTELSELVSVASGAAPAGEESVIKFNATAGMAYQIAVDTSPIAATRFHVYLTLPPANDDFTQRWTITATNTPIQGMIDGGTFEPGERDHARDSSSSSVWWKWVAPATGRAVVNSSGTQNPVFSVYTGGALDALTLVADCWGSSSGRSAAFDAVEGVEYQIAVAGAFDAEGAFTIQVLYVVAPPNDHFASALVFTNTSGLRHSVSGSTVGATTEPGDPSAGPSVWWIWTAPANAEMLLELDGLYTEGLLNPEVRLFRGTALSNLTEVHPRQEFYGTRYHDGRFGVQKDTNYFILVTSFSGPGGYQMKGRFEPPPANDNFGDRFVYTNTPFLFQYGYERVEAYNTLATKETGEPRHGGVTVSAGGQSVWWTWTAPHSGRVTASVNPIRYVFNSMVGVYTGTVLTNLTRIANAYTTCTDGHSAVAFPVTAGTTYQLAADGAGTGEFNFELDVDFDTNSPSITITSPLPGQVQAAELSVGGTATDPLGSGAFRYASGVSLVEVRLNDGEWQPATGTNAWSCPVTLRPGDNLIEARARDVIGNCSQTVGVRVAFGTLLPVCRVVDGQLQFTLPTETGKTYELQWVESLTPPLDWQPVEGATIPGTGGPVTCADPDWAGQPQRFYRLKVD